MGDRLGRREFLGVCARAGALAAVLPGAEGLLSSLNGVHRTVGDVASEPARYWEALDGGRVQKIF